MVLALGAEDHSGERVHLDEAPKEREPEHLRAGPGESGEREERLSMEAQHGRHAPHRRPPEEERHEEEDEPLEEDREAGDAAEEDSQHAKALGDGERCVP